MGPAAPGENQSQLNVFTASPGESIVHANKYTSFQIICLLNIDDEFFKNFYFVRRYLRLPIKEVSGLIIDSSNARHEVFDRFGKPKCKTDAINMLGDQSGKVHTVFRENGGNEFVKTIAVGEY